MQVAKSAGRSASQAMPAYFLLVAFYIIMLVSLPANTIAMQTYGLSAVEYKVILLTSALPSILVWLAAFFGYSRLKVYAASIQHTPEGAHFEQLAKGCAWLAWSLPVSSFVILLLNAIGSHWPNFHPTAIILGNYVSIILPLIAFSIIGGASRGLVSQAKVTFSNFSSRALMLLFALAGVAYCFLTFRQFDLTSLASTNNPYFLPIWLAVLTVTVPYFYTWFVGIIAAYEIRFFSKNVSGILYRQALCLLAGGLAAVILSFIALQYLNGVQPRTGHLVLNYKLPLVSIFRIIGGVGFLCIGLGAIRLKKIEEA